jgi:hypothetical protein
VSLRRDFKDGEQIAGDWFYSIRIYVFLYPHFYPTNPISHTSNGTISNFCPNRYSLVVLYGTTLLPFRTVFSIPAMSAYPFAAL